MYRELFLQAQAVRDFAYAPYSDFQVGAALLTMDGTMFTGVNVENASYGGTICAERVAFSKAISEGYREFEAIAIASGKEETWPCGICLQFMMEFGIDLKVVTGRDENHLQVYSLQELLPKGFQL